MTAVPAPGRPSSLPGLLEKLAVAVRPEFRGDELVFDLRDPVFGGKPCLVPTASAPPSVTRLCQGHRQRVGGGGRPGVREFAGLGRSVRRRRVRHPGSALWSRSGVDALPGRLKLEMQYALQRLARRARGQGPAVHRDDHGPFPGRQRASSLLDRTEQEWREAFGRKRSNAVALLAWSRRQVTDLAEGGGWDAEYPRDAWQMHRLGFAGRNVLDFSRIPAAAQRPGQTVDQVAAEHRPRPGSRRRPAAARPYPVRRLPPRPRHRRRSRGLTPAQLAGGFGLSSAVPLTGRIEESFGRQLDALPAQTRRLVQLAAADPSGDPVLVWRAAGRLAIGAGAARPE